MAQLKKHAGDLFQHSSNQEAPSSVLDMLNIGKPAPKRERTWEKQNPVYSFRIPAPLLQQYSDSIKEIQAIAEFDEAGNPRMDQTTADRVLGIFLDWAIEKVKQKPNLLPATPNPHGKGGLTVHLTAWNTWASGPVRRQPSGKKKTNNQKSRVVAHRIQAKTNAALRELASPQPTNGPLRYAIPAGEILVRLIQIALDGYFNRQFNITVSPSIVIQASGWKEN